MFFQRQLDAKERLTFEKGEYISALQKNLLQLAKVDLLLINQGIFSSGETLHYCYINRETYLNKRLYMDIFHPTYGIVWFLIGLIFFSLEFAIPTLTLFFFGIGSMTTACFLFFYPLSIPMQVCLFLLTAIATLFLFRSKVRSKKLLEKGGFYNSPNPLQPEILGFEVDVIESIVPPHLGRVLLHGAPWQASANHKIEKGARVKVIKRGGLVLFVEPLCPGLGSQLD